MASGILLRGRDWRYPHHGDLSPTMISWSRCSVSTYVGGVSGGRPSETPSVAPRVDVLCVKMENFGMRHTVAPWEGREEVSSSSTCPSSSRPLTKARRTHVLVLDGLPRPDAPSLIHTVDEAGADFQSRVKVDLPAMEPREEEVDRRRRERRREQA